NRAGRGRGRRFGGAHARVRGRRLGGAHARVRGRRLGGAHARVRGRRLGGAHARVRGRRLGGARRVGGRGAGNPATSSEHLQTVTGSSPDGHRLFRTDPGPERRGDATP